MSLQKKRLRNKRVRHRSGKIVHGDTDESHEEATYSCLAVDMPFGATASSFVSMQKANTLPPGLEVMSCNELPDSDRFVPQPKQSLDANLYEDNRDTDSVRPRNRFINPCAHQ